MQLSETPEDLKTLLESHLGYEHHLSCYDESLVFSIEHLPFKNDIFKNSRNGDQLVAFYYEQIRCYQLVLFKIENNTTEPLRRAYVRILDITEIFKGIDVATPVRILRHGFDDPITVGYSILSECGGNQFCVELDLARLRREFPRLVERISDAIVFLGEVLVAGDEE
jgi:hypothetical protein